MVRVSAAAIAAAALGFGEDAVEKAVAEALDRLFDAADVDQVAADAEDHCTSRRVPVASARRSVGTLNLGRLAESMTRGNPGHDG